MRSSLIRTAVVTSILTALVVTAAGMYIGPRLRNPASPTDASLQPATYQGANTSDAQPPADTQATPQLKPRAAITRQQARPVYRQAQDPQPAANSGYENSASARDPYGEPVHRGRSTRNSVLIVAGSAGTGAAIGALAGGGKGAGIGALAGGAAGLVYDRLTAHK